MTVSKTLQEQGYEVSPLGCLVLDHGYIGNGCGAGFVSKIIAKFAQFIYGVEYKTACMIHDAEWSIPETLKNKHHRINSDANFELNLILDTGPGLTVAKLQLAAWFHAAVTINSPIAYYRSEINV